MSLALLGTSLRTGFCKSVSHAHSVSSWLDVRQVATTLYVVVDVIFASVVVLPTLVMRKLDVFAVIWIASQEMDKCFLQLGSAARTPVLVHG